MTKNKEQSGRDHRVCLQDVESKHTEDSRPLKEQ